MTRFPSPITRAARRQPRLPRLSGLP